ncbi:hypothetical protein [Microbacterium sp. NPDC056052]|uniref:hypothetical protein n=1 Tax=Microbacterium sp. NPDC056052 TaxID=3345695 RepID=UPI0035D59D93
MQNKNPRRWWWTTIFLSAVVIGICAIVIALWLLPALIVDMDSQDGEPLETAARQAAIAAVRQVILFCAGGLIAIVTLIFTWRRDQITRASADLAVLTSTVVDAVDRGLASDAEVGSF